MGAAPHQQAPPPAVAWGGSASARPHRRPSKIKGTGLQLHSRIPELAALRQAFPAPGGAVFGMQQRPATSPAGGRMAAGVVRPASGGLGGPGGGMVMGAIGPYALSADLRSYLGMRWEQLTYMAEPPSHPPTIPPCNSRCNSRVGSAGRTRAKRGGVGVSPRATSPQQSRPSSPPMMMGGGLPPPPPPLGGADQGDGGGAQAAAAMMARPPRLAQPDGSVVMHVVGTA